MRAVRLLHTARRDRKAYDSNRAPSRQSAGSAVAAVIATRSTTATTATTATTPTSFFGYFPFKPEFFFTFARLIRYFCVVLILPIIPAFLGFCCTRIWSCIERAKPS